ncbi:MAG: universal stress protein [Gammaproteobacteria bacterium]
MFPEIKTIVYASDLGEHTRPVFRHAIAIAQKFGAKIVVAHVMEPLGVSAQAIIDSYLPEGSYAELHEEGFAKTRELLKERIEKACKEELGVSAEESHLIDSIEVIEGFPAQAIYDLARKRDAQLIVMGSHSHSRLGELFLGSTARKLTHISKIPVLLVPTEDD